VLPGLLGDRGARFRGRRSRRRFLAGSEAGPGHRSRRALFRRFGRRRRSGRWRRRRPSGRHGRRRDRYRHSRRRHRLCGRSSPPPR